MYSTQMVPLLISAVQFLHINEVNNAEKMRNLITAHANQ